MRDQVRWYRIKLGWPLDKWSDAPGNDDTLRRESLAVSKDEYEGLPLTLDTFDEAPVHLGSDLTLKPMPVANKLLERNVRDAIDTRDVSVAIKGQGARGIRDMRSVPRRA